MSAWRAIGLFVLLTACLSGVFWTLIIVTQTPNPYYVWLLMWMPGVSALLTCRILRRPLRTLGWAWNWRYVLGVLALPLLLELELAVVGRCRGNGCPAR